MSFYKQKNKFSPTPRGGHKFNKTSFCSLDDEQRTHFAWTKINENLLFDIKIFQTIAFAIIQALQLTERSKLSKWWSFEIYNLNFKKLRTFFPVSKC